MKVIGWTSWCDPRYPDKDLNDCLFKERWAATIDELRKHNIRFSGFYHQRDDYGVPVFDDGKAFHVSFRSWGHIMAEAYPETVSDNIFGYAQWAWASPGDQGSVSPPIPDIYPDFLPWNRSPKE